MRRHLNLHPHIILPQPRHPHTRPDGLMVRHIALEVTHHRVQRLVVDRHMVRVHPEHLTPALSACVLQVQLDVCEGLVDLRVDFPVDDPGVGVPASWGDLVLSFKVGRIVREVGSPCPAHSMRSPTRTAWL